MIGRKSYDSLYFHSAYLRYFLKKVVNCSASLNNKFVPRVLKGIDDNVAVMNLRDMGKIQYLK